MIQKTVKNAQTLLQHVKHKLYTVFDLFNAPALTDAPPPSKIEKNLTLHWLKRIHYDYKIQKFNSKFNL